MSLVSVSCFFCFRCPTLLVSRIPFYIVFIAYLTLCEGRMNTCMHINKCAMYIPGTIFVDLKVYAGDNPNEFPEAHLTGRTESIPC